MAQLHAVVPVHEPLPPLLLAYVIDDTEVASEAVPPTVSVVELVEYSVPLVGLVIVTTGPVVSTKIVSFREVEILLAASLAQA